MAEVNKICFQCDRNPRDPGDFLCWSCKEEHRLCYECGERERNLPFRLCTPCYEASKKSVPVDGIIPTASIFSSGTTATATSWGMYVGTTLLYPNVFDTMVLILTNFLQMMTMMMVGIPVCYPDAQALSTWRHHLVVCTTSVAKPMQWSTLLCMASVSFELEPCPQDKRWMMNFISLQLLSVDQLPHVSLRADLFFSD